MKYLFRCEKLVRDRIPELMSARGNDLEVETLDRKAHIWALKQKLKEEALEIEHALTREEIIEEIADVREVLDALALTLSITTLEIEEIKRKKSLKNGGFDRGLFLKSVKTYKDSETAAHFLKDPAKYPFVDCGNG